GGFATGSIDLGGLEVRQVSTFTKVWATLDGGPGDVGAGFFNPTEIPADFYSLGSYAQPNNRPLNGWVLVARDAQELGILAKPLDYTLVWSAESTSVKRVGDGFFWLPTPPSGYKAVGLLVTDSAQKPPLDRIRCVRADFTDQSEPDTSLWSTNDGGFSVSSLRPSDRGVQARGVCAGTFTAQSNGSPSTLACLKNLSAEFTSAMPNLAQIEALMQAYSPVIYLHPDEQFFPSSVTWFFSNGALLYQKGNPNPTAIAPDGSNLPQGGSNDGEYWIDLPADDKLKAEVKAGDLNTARVYLHVKPMLGGTFTDLALWIFYPFNGAARAKVEFLNVSLGRIGEHVGDWEHVTLRVSNFGGELRRVYYAAHSAGEWVDASQAEYDPSGGNKPVAYASLHGHAAYAKAGSVLQGNEKLQIGIRNDTAKGKEMDTAGRWELVAAEYDDVGEAVAEPAWLEYMREWGPKTSYDIAKELKGVERLLPKRLRRALEKLVAELPAEVLGEEGPTGPKDKSSWTMDEK
ncbi:hypothetical protein ACMD2_26541, partial [Ananas comosus]